MQAYEPSGRERDESPVEQIDEARNCDVGAEREQALAGRLVGRDADSAHSGRARPPRRPACA
jgi:hypothetical protein